MTGIRKSPQIFYFRKCRSCFAKCQVLFICLAKYNKYHMNSYNSAKIDKDIAQLIDDDEIKKLKVFGNTNWPLILEKPGLLNTLI